MATTPIRILHMDDSPLDAQLVAMTLEIEQENFPTSLKYVRTRDEYLAALQRKDFDIILSDYRMPGYDGDDALASAQETCPEIPFIMVTGELGEEFAVERLQRGATDYVLKDRIFRLVPAIKRALAEAENKKKRREAERESQKRQGELWAIFQAMHGGVTVFDAEGNVVLVNEAEVEMLGYTDANELRHNFSYFVDLYEFFDEWENVVPLEDWPFPRVMRGETVVNLELRGRRKDTGSEWFFSFSGQPVYDENGKQILSVVVMRDIADRKKREEDLRNAQRATSEILESIRDPFYSLDSQWHFTYVNAKCEEFFNRQRDEMLGKSLLDVFPEVSGTESERALKAVAATRKPILYETQSVIRDAWVEVHIFPKADGGLSVLYRDISRRRAQEQALRSSEDRFRATFRESPYPSVLSRVRDGVFTDANDAYLTFLGVSREELIGHSSFELGLFSDPDERTELVKKLEKSGTVHGFEMHIRTRSQGERLVRLSVTLLRASKDGTMLSILNDITEAKQAEDALKETEMRLRLIQEASLDGFTIHKPRYDEHGKIVDFIFQYENSAAARSNGTVPEDVVGRGLLELFPGLRGSRFFEAFQEAASTGQPVELQEHYQGESVRSDTWFRVLVVPAEGMLGVLTQDVTARHQMEEALHRRESDLTRAQKAAHLGSWRWDLRSDTVTWSEELYRIFGVDPTTFVPSNPAVHDMIHPGDRDSYAAYLTRALQGETVPPFETRIVRPSGEERIVLASGFDVEFDRAGKPVTLHGTILDITQRRENEEAFRQVAERYTTLFSAIREGFAHYGAVYNEAGKLIDLLVVDINPAGARISGVEREVQVGRRWRQIWPNVEDELFAMYEKVDRTGESLHFEHKSAITGGFYHTHVAKSAPGEFVVTFFDITERRQMEEALREKEETLGLAIEATGLGLFDYRPRTGQLEWNALAKKHFGLSPEAHIDYEVFLKGLHPEDRKRAHEAVQAVLAPGSDGHYHIEYRTIGLEDGKERWLDSRARVFFNEQGEAVRMLGATQDVSSNKSLSLALERQNRELVAERTKWEHLIEGIADEIWSCDTSGKMSLMNLVTHPAMQLEEFTERTIQQLNEEVDILNIDGTLRAAEDAPLLQALKGRIVRGEEIMSHRTTGIRRYRQYNAVPVRDAEGNIVGSVAIVRDVTQERQAEIETRRAEQAVRVINEELEERVQQRTRALEAANRELESFSYSVSHDLKAPLRLINGFADLLVRQGQENLTQKQRESLATIQTQTARMGELIKALLEFSRLTRKGLRLVGIDTKRMVEEVVAEQRQILGGEAGNRILVDVAEMPTVEADPILLRMVFTNLLSNAFKFTRTVADPRVAIDAKEIDGFWSFRIHDNGVGFPKGQTERLFQVFQRLHGYGEFEGTGIGLANVRKIVERHGGQVCGEGEEGGGATFFFTLPVKPRPSEASENRTSRLAV